MYLRRMVKAALVSSIVGFGLPAFADDNVFNDFTQPTFGATTADGETYVDISVKQRSNCKQYPGRPAWMMVHPKGFEWRKKLALEYKSVIVGRLIKESGKCTCDYLYSNINEMRPEIKAMWERVGDQPKSNWNKGIVDSYYSELKILMSESRHYSFAIGRLCGNPE